MDQGMMAAVLHAPGDLRVETVPIPALGEEEVLLQIKACGICGSDLPRVLTKGTYHFPTVPGHEFAGKIVEAADRTLIGKKAAVFPLLPCCRCVPCERGEYAQCENYDYYGSRRDGGFEEYLAVKRWNLVLLPDQVSYEEGAMCEPAAVALHAVMQGNIKLGEHVAIFGAGPIGMMAAQWARKNGASRVSMVDIDQSKLEFAKQMGFAVYDEAEQADVVIEGTGASSALESCLKAAKPFGTVVLMGNPGGEMKISAGVYSGILRKQLQIKGTWNSSYNNVQNDWRMAAEAMGDGSLQLKPLISHRYSLAQCNEAFAMMSGKQESYSKVMLYMNQEGEEK